MLRHCSPAIVLSCLLGPAVAAQSMVWRLDGTARMDQLGSSVAFVPDVNGVGIADVLAGAPADQSYAAALSGRAAIYSGATGAILHEWVGAGPQDHFGYAVAALDDIDDDGTA